MTQPSPIYRALRSGWRKVKMLRFYRKLMADHLYDLGRYFRWSHGTDTDRTQAQAQHAIYKAYHGVEKGLSLSAPRPGFGAPKIAALMEKLTEYARRFDPRGVPAAVSALESYRSFNAGHQIETPALNAFLEAQDTTDQGGIEPIGGTKPVTREELLAATQSVGQDFFWTRHSVRQYSPEPVADGADHRGG